jgi:hypothetical protein
VKLIWMAAPALVAVAVAGCSDAKPSSAAMTSTVTPTTNSVSATVAPSDVTEPSDGVRITFGETKEVTIPADAVMDIKVPAEWGPAASNLRCTVTDSTGRNEDLRSSDVKKQETIGGKEWLTIWTFSSPPAAEVTVGCKDPDSKVPVTDTNYIRVVPRGITPR